MKKKFITDSFGIEIEIGDNGRMKGIDIVEIDADVFPALAVDDKMAMMRFAEAVWVRLREILLGQAFLEGGATVQAPVQHGGVAIGTKEAVEVECSHCGKKFPAKKPCRSGCKGKTTTEICPLCRKPVMIEWE